MGNTYYVYTKYNYLLLPHIIQYLMTTLLSLQTHIIIARQGQVDQ